MGDAELQGLQPSLHGNLLHMRDGELLNCGLIVSIIALRVCEEEEEGKAGGSRKVGKRKKTKLSMEGDLTLLDFKVWLGLVY